MSKMNICPVPFNNCPLMKNDWTCVRDGGPLDGICDEKEAK